MIHPIPFILLAAVAVAAAVGMLLSRNAIHSALYLVLNFMTVAVFYLVLNAPFIAMVQITVYAGAIVILFLFVIMLLGAERLRSAAGEVRPAPTRTCSAGSRGRPAGSGSRSSRCC